jgi:hypothetical protein
MMTLDDIRKILPCRCIDRPSSWTGHDREICPIGAFDCLTGANLPPEILEKEEGMGGMDLNIQLLINVVCNQSATRKPEVTRLVDYIRVLEARGYGLEKHDVQEYRLAWDGYANAMLRSSPGLHVDTAIMHADKMLEYRRKKFGSNS